MTQISIEARRLHRKLFNDLSRQIDPDQYRYIQSSAAAYLSRGDVSRCDNFLKLLDKLEVSGHVNIGQYTILKQILSDSQLNDCLDIVLETDNQIEETMGCTGIRRPNGETRLVPTKEETQLLSAKLSNDSIAAIRAKSAKFQTYCQGGIDGIFVETGPSKTARVVLENNNSVLIVGGSGDGKSFILHHLAATPLPGYLPIPCESPEDVQRHAESVQGTDIKLAFIIDECCGGSYVQSILLDAWVRMSKMLEMYLTDHKFVFATRQTVWEVCKVHLGDNTFFCNVVEVTSGRLTEVDKRNILQSHLKDEKERLTSKEINYIVGDMKAIAFGQCCRLMSEAIKNRDLSGKDLTSIFQRPYRYLQSQLEIIKRKEKKQYATLCLIMLCGGTLNCEELAGSLSDATTDIKNRIECVLEDSDCKGLTCGSLQECAESLTGTWLEKTQCDHVDGSTGCISEEYKFSHDSMYESVTISYGNRHFLHLLNFVPADIIVQIARPKLNDDISKINQFEFVVTVNENYYKHLVPVFTEKASLGSRDLQEVFQNPCVREERFQFYWCEYFRSSPDKLAAFGHSFAYDKDWLGSCILFFAAKSGIQLWTFLKEKQIACGHRCRDGNCALSGAASGNQIRLVELLCSTNNITESQLHSAVLCACESGCIDALKILLPKLKHECRSHTLSRGLVKACVSGQIETVEYMLVCAGGLCCDSHDCQKGLVEASGEGHTNIVRLLLSQGCDINGVDDKGRSSIPAATLGGHMETVRYLVSQG